MWSTGPPREPLASHDRAPPGVGSRRQIYTPSLPFAAVSANRHFRTGPLRTLDDVEYATMEWVDWYNRRLHSQLNYVPR